MDEKPKELCFIDWKRTSSDGFKLKLTRNMMENR